MIAVGNSGSNPNNLSLSNVLALPFVTQEAKHFMYKSITGHNLQNISHCLSFLLLY